MKPNESAFPIPRIRGRVGQATEPEDVAGKWFFEVWFGALGDGDGDSLGMFGPWETEEKAQAELRTACKLVCEEVERMTVGRVSGKYIDMKTNQMREWKADLKLKRAEARSEGRSDV